MFRDHAFVVAARGWSVELRDRQTFGDLHAVLAAVFGWAPDEDYAFAFTGGPAPALGNPDEVVDRADAPIVPLWFYVGPAERRFWLVGGAGRDRRNRLEVTHRRRAYGRLTYPRVVRTGKGRSAPAVVGDETEAAHTLRSAARRWSEQMAGVVTVLRTAADDGAVTASAWDEAAVRVSEFLDWCKDSRSRFDVIADHVADDLPELLDDVLVPELARRRRFAQGFAVAEGLLRIAPSAQMLATVAVMLKGLGRPEEAVETYSQILDRFPSSDMARIIVAQIGFEEGRRDEAEKLLGSVIDDPEDDRVLRRAVDSLAGMLDERGAPAEAARVRERLAFAEGAAPAEPAPRDAGPRPWGFTSAPARSAHAVGRNDPCPCGSGRKFKKCCGAPVQASGPEQSALPRVVAAVAAFAECSEVNEARRDAIAEWFGEEFASRALSDVIDVFPNSAAGMAALEGVLFDACGRDGRTIADQFAASHAARLIEPERKVLDRLRASSLSLHQITAVAPGAGFEAIDLLRGTRVAVRELGGSRELARWDLLAMRLIELDGTTQMCAGALAFSVTRKNEVLERLHRALEDHRALFPDASLDEALKDVGDEFLAATLARSVQPPQLATTDGERLFLSKAHFRIANPVAAARALASPPLEEVEPGRELRWSEPREGPMGNVTLGRIAISGCRLTLECFSKERLERGKDLVRSRLGAGVQHVGDEFTAPERLLAEAAQAPNRARVSEADDLPPDVIAEIERGFKERHYRAWVDEPVPALDGATPRAAAVTANGRRRVAEILREFENAEDRAVRAGRRPYDFGWLWRDLGIGREEGL